MVGGTRFYDRREVKDILAYLRLLANPADEVSARRMVNVPKRGMGATSVVRLAAWAAANGRSLADALSHAEEAGLSGRALRGAGELDGLLAELREAMGRLAPGELVQLVAERTGYLAELVAERSHEADGRLENVAELVGVAGEYEELSELLETVALVSDSDELDADGARVSLMTLHTAKGLEFPAVFLVGLEDGIFPHFRALGEPAELEEERRLCYVGITRARRWLHLSHAWVRTLWGRTSHNIPSRFLAEVPAELVPDVGLVGAGAAPAPPQRPTRAVPGRSSAPDGDRPSSDGRRGPGPGRAPGPRGSAWWRARPWSTTTGARAWWWRPTARASGPRPRCGSPRWARSACCCRPPRCAGPEDRPRRRAGPSRLASTRTPPPIIGPDEASVPGGGGQARPRRPRPRGQGDRPGPA